MPSSSWSGLGAAEAGDHELAARHLRWFTDADVGNLPVDIIRFRGLVVSAHPASVVDDADAAGVLFPLLEPYDGQWVALGCYGGGAWGPVSHALGALSATLGRAVSARSYLDGPRPSRSTFHRRRLVSSGSAHGSTPRDDGTRIGAAH